MKLMTKKELMSRIDDVFSKGWIPSVKATRDMRNDGAVGNTLESELGLAENNLPIPNAGEWELKGQRENSQSLITLKHVEPSPRAIRIVPEILLPLYGWRHDKAGSQYGSDEMSFRSTTLANRFNSRGFRIRVDRDAKKLLLVFDSTEVSINAPKHAEWLEEVRARVGLGPLSPEPYWGFEDLEAAIAVKLRNCFYAVAQSQMFGGHEYFRYVRLLKLSGFSFERFLAAVEAGVIVVDFDARTGHNHGTKFRLRQHHWTDLYDEVETVLHRP